MAVTGTTAIQYQYRACTWVAAQFNGIFRLPVAECDQWRCSAKFAAPASLKTLCNDYIFPVQQTKVMQMAFDRGQIEMQAHVRLFLIPVEAAHQTVRECGWVLRTQGAEILGFHF